MGLMELKMRNVYFRFVSILNDAGVVLIFFMALWICSDVIGRFVFNRPIPGTPELVKCLIAAIVFLCLVHTLCQGRHVRSDLILKRLPPWGATSISILASLLGVIMFALVAWYSGKQFWAGWLIREYEGVQLQVPVYPIRFILAFCAALFSLQFAFHLLAGIRGLFSRRRVVV